MRIHERHQKLRALRAAVPVAPTPLLGQTNFKTSQFTTLKAAINRVKSGAGRGRIVYVGDSTTWGEGGGDSGGNMRINAKERCYPTIVAKRLTALGIPANYENLFASGANSTVTLISDFQSPTSYKSGFSCSGAWGFSTSTAAGGCVFTNTTDTTGTISITPQINVDTFEIYDLVVSTGGSISYSLDGAAATTLNQAGASALRKTVVKAAAVGAHTLAIKRVSGNAFFIGYRAYDSTKPEFDVINVGRGSSQTSDWIVNANPWSPLPMMTDLCATADLVVLDFTINNALLSPTSYNTTYPTQMQTLINAAKAGGASVMLSTGNPSNTVSNIPDATQQLFRQAITTLANTNDLPLIDQYAKYTSWDAMNALGFMYNKNHPNTAGYSDLGNFESDTLKAWAV
jgi:lysophospholipase L1-like esterase